MREQDALPEQPLVTRRKLNLGDGECMAEMQRAIHVRIGEVAEPFWMFLIQFVRSKVCDVGLGWRVDLEKTLLLPSLLVLYLE